MGWDWIGHDGIQPGVPSPSPSPIPLLGWGSAAPSPALAPLKGSQPGLVGWQRCVTQWVSTFQLNCQRWLQSLTARRSLRQVCYSFFPKKHYCEKVSDLQKHFRFGDVVGKIFASKSMCSVKQKGLMLGALREMLC